VIKSYKKYILIIIFMLFVSNDLSANNIFFADNRFTEAARASDYSQCASIFAIYKTAKISAYIGTNVACVSLGGVTCPGVAKLAGIAAGYAALYGTYVGYSAWAEDVRLNSKVVNTIDPQKPECSIDGSASDVFNNWKYTGPLGDYCYKKEYDHTLEENTHIYNNGKSKIGISYKGGEPVWISPQDCDSLATNSFENIIGGKRQFCAWTEGDEICADGVFCTGLIIGDILPIYGFVGDAERSPKHAKRNCGDNPYTNELVDDYDNGRCECYCCTGSDKNKDCNNVVTSCKTYNEKYRAHCVKRAMPSEEVLNPLKAPKSLSIYCRLSTESGYKNFSFIGRTVRCISKTIENLYFGREDKIIRDANGEILIDQVTNSPQFINQCIDGQQDSAGNCSKGLYLKMQKNFANIITIFLTLWIAVLGAKFLLGSGMTAAELSKAMLQLSVILYFVSGTGWKDGYYKFLMNAGYELSAGYIGATMSEQGKFDFIEKTKVIAFKDKETGQCKTNQDNNSNIEVATNVGTCNFINGVDPSGYKYPVGDAYYGVLDSLDCRFAKYIGFDINNQFPEILTIATAAIFQTPSGFMFFIAAIVFVYVSILLLLRVSFMLASITIIISFLIFISPLIIPLMLFSKTKKIFDKWLAHLLGYSLQPFVILVLISLFVVLIDGFFMAYLAPIYESSSSVAYFETDLGIKAPLQGGTGQSLEQSFVGLMKFIFLLVIIMSIFNKISSLLQQLTGVGGIENYITPPNFNEGINSALKKPLQLASKAGGLAAGNLRKYINEDRDQKDASKDIKLNKDGKDKNAIASEDGKDKNAIASEDGKDKNAIASEDGKDKNAIASEDGGGENTIAKDENNNK